MMAGGRGGQNIALHFLCGTVCWWSVSCTPPLLFPCAEASVHIVYESLDGPQVQSVQVRIIRTQERTAAASRYTNYAIQTPSLCVNDN
jgi:hypothetical protein